VAKTEEYKILINADTRKAIGGVKGLAAGFKALGVAVVAAGVVKFGKEMIDASKKMQTFQNQLRLVTKNQADLERLMGRLTQASIQNRTSFAATAELFQKLAVSTGDLGKSEDQLINVTGKLSQALAVAGADAGTTNGVIRQFGQAMASGVVRGDEFNSIVEGLGPALAIMAQESGLNVGELRKMAQAGKLTAEVMFEMFENSESLSASFNQMSITTEQLETQFSDSFTFMLAALSETTGATGLYNDTLSFLGRQMDKLSGRQGALVNMTEEQLLTYKNTAAALEELITRESELVPVLEEKLRVEKEQAEINKAKTEAYNAEVKQINQLLGTNKKLVTQYKSMDVKNFLSGLEKLKATYKESEQAVTNLSLTMETLNQEGLDNTHMYGSIEQALKNATIARDAHLKKLTEELEKTKEKNKEDFQAAQQQKRSNELTYLSLRAATETNDVLKARIQNLSAYKNTLKNIAQAEFEGAISAKDATTLKADAEAAYTQGYQELAEERIQSAREEELEKMRVFMDAEKKKRNELLLTRQFQFKQAGMSDEVARKAAENIQQYEENKTEFLIGQGANFFKAFSKQSKEAFEAYKAFQIAQALMDTYKAATAAYASLAVIPVIGPALGAAAAVAAIGFGMQQVNAIKSQNYSGRQFGGPVTGGSSFMVGENGPEVFTPSQNGRVLNQNQMSGTGTTNVNFTINAVDAEGIDEILVSRRGLITNIIREASETNGVRSAF